jgi:hypothetical protein
MFHLRFHPLGAGLTLQADVCLNLHTLSYRRLQQRSSELAVERCGRHRVRT